MDTMDTMKKWQDEYFDFVKRVEAPVLRYTGQMAETVARYVPERPAFMAPVPPMHLMVDNSLKFRKRFVDEQAAFVRHMMKAMDPVLTKVDAPVAKKPTTTPRATAAKAPRRVVKAA